MKKIILVLAAVLTVIIVNGQTFTFNVKDGKGNPVTIERNYMEIFSLTKEALGDECFEKFVQSMVDECKRKCKYPVTFVPTFIGFFFKDTVTITNGDEEIVLYKYNYRVAGYAKNGMGVECEVSHFPLCYDKKPEVKFGSDLSGQLAKINYYDEHAPKFVTKKYKIVNEAMYEHFPEVYKNKETISFEYDGWKYYIVLN